VVYLIFSYQVVVIFVVKTSQLYILANK